MLNRKIVVVIGGRGLLGKNFVQAIAVNGGIPIIADYNNADEFEVRSDGIKAFQVNIAIPESVENLINRLHQVFGKVDAVVNCAYPRNENFGAHFFDVTYEDFCENTNSHLGGYFLVCQKFSKYFITQGWGNIINLSSIYGVIPPRYEIYDGTEMTVPIEYAVTKTSIIHMTKYLAKYLKGKNIRVNSVSPGGILDNQNPLFLTAYNNNCLNKGMLDKVDINGTILFLLSDLSVNINGQNIIVDDGFTL